MDHLPRKYLPHDVPQWLHGGEKFFLTLCCEERGHNQLCTPAASQIILDSVKFYHERGDWYCNLVLLMPDHVHAIVSFPPDKSMVSFVRKFKIYTARKAGVFWQRDFFDHRLRDDQEVDFKSNYIRQNPVRAGFVESVEGWSHWWAALPA